MKVLIVDDQSDNRYLLSSLFTSKGCEVVAAEDGVAALEALHRESVDVIVSDGLMPRMDGFQLCAAVRNNEALRQIPFVFYTATFTESEDAQLASELGADRFLVKPIDPAELFAIVKELNATRPNHSRSTAQIDESPLAQYDRRLVKKLEDHVEKLQSADRVVRTTARRFEMLSEASPSGVFRLDSQGHIAYSNPVLASLTGFTTQELYGLPLGALFETDPIRTAAATEAPKSVRVTTKSVRSPHRWLLIQLVVNNDDDPCWIGTVTDVTAERALLEREKRERRTATLESLGLVAGGVAHDFNNFLTVFMAGTSLALLSIPNGHPARQDLDEVSPAFERAKELVQQLLCFVRSGGKEPEVVPLNEDIERSVKLLSGIWDDVHIQWSPSSEPLYARINSAQLHQLIQNLIGNARDAMRGRVGAIRLQTSSRKLGSQTEFGSTSLSPGPYHVIEVSDAGCGIPEDLLPHIFEPMVTSKLAMGGSGLGLALVRAVAHGHSGAVEAESAPGKGATFRIYFPASDQPMLTKKPNVDLSARLSGKRVLVAESEPLVMRYAESLLSSSGAIVHRATNAMEVLSALDHVDAMLLDEALRDAPLLSMVARIRARRPTMPMTITTSFLNGDELNSMREMPNLSILYKPFDLISLSRAIVRSL
jgi:signal transduction histidine kinase/DNA-binding response OmpR family regulator